MEFSTNLRELMPPQSFSVDVVGLKIPSNKDVYIRSLQEQIVEQYSVARMFLSETDTTDWQHWHGEIKNEVQKNHYEWSMRGTFLECALFYYNVVIDLSWTLCYVAAEYSVSAGGEQRTLFEGIASIDEAWDLLSKAQRNVTSPTSEENPFDYLAKMCPEYSQSVDLIKAFWNEYQDSSLRQLYNYCKHRGKPFYTELTKKGNPPKLMSIYLMVEGQKTEIPTATGEVMKKVSIQETIEALHSFDEGKLFPYIQKLIEEIVRVVQPSPIVL